MTHIPHGNSVTKSQRLEHADTESQFGNLSCARGRSHLVCYINNNKRPFHGTSPVLSNHRDLSEAPGKSPVCLPSSLSVFFFSAQIIHSSPPHPIRYLELYLKVMFNVRVHRRHVRIKESSQMCLICLILSSYFKMLHCLSRRVPRAFRTTRIHASCGPKKTF